MRDGGNPSQKGFYQYHLHYSIGKNFAQVSAITSCPTYPGDPPGPNGKRIPALHSCRKVYSTRTMFEAPHGDINLVSSLGSLPLGGLFYCAPCEAKFAPK
ncbi:hypothetical protein RRG08_059149 [Elysia crispata]|uniref:Uncharacterized protein n=1 Tax=Elysia crispata TaxID=231223 RepID=A0AAE0ZVY5_9GAST|nr:hypothetical protein RRG08_059149 [Elysia crispata]